MNIPIHKHTPVRRRHSMYRTTILVDTFINGIPLLYSTDIPRTGVIPIVHTGTTKERKQKYLSVKLMLIKIRVPL